MRKYVALGTVALLGFGGQVLAAEADGFSYSNVEASYVSLNLKGTSADADGFGISGSYEFTDNFSVFAGYNDLDVDGGGSIKQTNIGLGFNWPINDKLDITSGLSYEDVDFGGGFDANGYGLQVGLRGRVADAFEVTANVKYTDLGSGFDEQTTFTVGGRYYFTPNFAAGIDFSDEDDLGSAWRIAVRYDFGG
jgi:hypothetical protein